MAKFSLNKKDFIFGAIGLFLGLAILLSAFFAVKFAISVYNKASDPNLLQSPDIVKFNLQKVKELRR